MLATIIANLLSDPKTSIALKVRIFRLFDASLFENNKLHQPLIELAFDGEMVFLRERATGILGDFVESDLKGQWLQEVVAIRGSKLTSESYEAFLYLIPRYRGTSLPSPIKNILINEAIADTANSSKTLEAISRFYNVVESIDYFCDIIIRTKNSLIRRNSIELIGSYQGKANVDWQTDNWNKLFESSTEFSQQERLALLTAVAFTERIQAVALLEKSLMDKDRRVQKAAMESLQTLATSKNSKVADAAVQAISGYHSNPISE